MTVVLVLVTLAGCSGAGDRSPSAPAVVRLGFFPNLTHAPAIVGIEQGLFQRVLGSTSLATSTFNAGPEATEALLSGAIDAAFMGTNPTINAFARSGGAIQIIAGTTSGGARLVVRPGIESANDLIGTTLATPQLGGTQDVALRWWLKEHGIRTTFTGGGEVSIQPQENAQILESFRNGRLDGAWVPEPWATRLVSEGDGNVLVDESDLWPGGRFVTTQLVVSTAFADDHPDIVEQLVQGLTESIDAMAADPVAARSSVADGIERVTSKRLPDQLIESAWSRLTFTVDPIATSLQSTAEHARALDLPTTTDLHGIYRLGPLNRVLQARGRPEVLAP